MKIVRKKIKIIEIVKNFEKKKKEIYKFLWIIKNNWERIYNLIIFESY